MLTEKFKLNDLREFGTILRSIMNDQKSKYSLQINASLYLPHNEGGRGLKNFETLYKKIRLKAAMNLLCAIDPRTLCVKDFDRDRMSQGKSSIIHDVILYAEQDFNIAFEPTDIWVSWSRHREKMSTSNILAVKVMLKKEEINNLVVGIQSLSWQEVIPTNRYSR